MKTIPTKYVCEICGWSYSTPQEALKCESRIKPVYPVGLVFGDHKPNAFYHAITFAISDSKDKSKGHVNHQPLWACRDKRAGDSLDGKRCLGSNGNKLSHYDANIDPEQPHFKRMIKYLKSRGIPITIWDGEKPVPYDEWKNNYVKWR